jgi:hypothetical protein
LLGYSAWSPWLVHAARAFLLPLSAGGSVFAYVFFIVANTCQICFGFPARSKKTVSLRTKVCCLLIEFH